MSWWTATEPMRPPDNSPFEIGHKVKGRYEYRLDELLAEGGSGFVYRATCVEGMHNRTSQVPGTVAIKVVTPDAGIDPKALAQREVAAQDALDHPRIPKLYDWWYDEPYGYIVTQFYPAGSLMSVYVKTGALSHRAAWKLLNDLLEALVAAHRRSVLHLDIKPGNVLLDGDGGYVLADFGISQTSHVREGRALSPGRGTFGFNAPEQRALDVDRIGIKTDLWGVGATVWSAYAGINLSGLRVSSTDAEREDMFYIGDVRLYRADADHELNKILQNLLAEDPELRPGGAAEILARVKAHFDPSVSVELPGRFLMPDQIDQVVGQLIDPFLSELLSRTDIPRYFMTFKPSEILCRQGEMSHYAFVLLQGSLVIERNKHRVAIERREGTFIGEIGALTGILRTATVRAMEPTTVWILNNSQLEKVLTKHPALSIRLMKLLCERLAM